VPGALFAILIALCVSGSARELQQAPSPAPTTLPVADLLFILSVDQVSTNSALVTPVDHRILNRLDLYSLSGNDDCYQCSMVVILVYIKALFILFSGQSKR